MELQTGLFQQSSLDKTRCMCYLRTITDMEKDMNIVRVHNYVDVSLDSVNLPSSSYVSTEMLDLDAQERISAIREVMFLCECCAENMYSFCYLIA